jgi:phosphoribosylamine--glycine ligase
MRILVVGGGAREHALAWTLTRDGGHQLICAPGNPGIADLARCEPADVGDPQTLLQLARREAVELTVVGPEVPLSHGIVDVFVADGRSILGPTRAAAALEWSKVFAKDFMARHGVPTARFRVCETADDALSRIARDELGYPLVVKADGLAAGKGVVIADDRSSAQAAVRQMMLEKRFGAAGDRIVLEEFLVGQEASYFVLSDGVRFVSFSSAQDHKRIFDGDAGPNTGGMGAFAPSPLLTSGVRQRVDDEVVRPVLAGMAQEGHPYRGFLYVGLMLTAEGPRVVEFNVRFGDPEAQVVLPMLDEPLSGWLQAAAQGQLPGRAARFRPEPHVGVVLAAGGYPEQPLTGQPIRGLVEAARVPNAMVFHAGTRREGNDIVTAGGRVLTVVGRGPSYQDAIDAAYRAAAAISFEGMQLRRDIGRKAVEAVT